MSENCDKIQQKSCRYYNPGIHQKVPIHARMANYKVRDNVEMLLPWNRLIQMNDNRIIKKVVICNVEICNNKWSNEIKLI